MLVNQLFESAAGSTSASISCMRGYYSKMAPGTVKRAIAAIINKSLQTGHFPEGWKEALVHPSLKKPGLDAVKKNFRLVSNLAFVSKFTEKAAFDGTYSHVSANGSYRAVGLSSEP